MDLGLIRKVSVIGLGYVGLPVAAAFGKKQKVVAFDINRKRIEELKKGIDHTREISAEKLSSSDLHFTNNPRDLRQANFHIITVPTPIDLGKQPNLVHLLD